MVFTWILGEASGRQFRFVLGHVVISGVEVLLVFSLQLLHQHGVALALVNIPIARSENFQNDNLATIPVKIFTSVELPVVEEDSEPSVSCSQSFW